MKCSIRSGCSDEILHLNYSQVKHDLACLFMSHQSSHHKLYPLPSARTAHLSASSMCLGTETHLPVHFFWVLQSLYRNHPKTLESWCKEQKRVRADREASKREAIWTGQQGREPLTFSNGKASRAVSELWPNRPTPLHPAFSYHHDLTGIFFIQL